MKGLYSLIIVFMFLNVTACARPDREQVPGHKKMWGLIDQNQLSRRAQRTQIFDHTPNGDDSYSQGFQDGCATATSAIGTGFFRTAGPRFYPDRLATDSWYLRGFQDASTYCTFNLDWETH